MRYNKFNKYNKKRNFKQEERPAGMTVIVRDNDVNKALRVLKKKLQKDGLLKELKAKQYFEKPSEKKRRKKKEGIANFKKKQKKLRLTRGY